MIITGATAIIAVVIYCSGVGIHKVGHKMLDDAGKVALWTKADSVTHFDDFRFGSSGS